MKSDVSSGQPAAKNSEKPRARGGKLFGFSDEFQRDNSENLGKSWVDGNQLCPEHYEPLGIFDHGVVVSNPTTRPGVYDARPPSEHPLPDNKIQPAIGCAWTETGASRVAVKIIWSGHFGRSYPVPVSHVEATPLLYISPENPRFGFGAWFSELFGRIVMYVGYIGAPPEDFEVIATARRLGEHTSGTPREVELRAEAVGEVTVWLDGEQVRFDSDIGLSPIKVDPTMIGSTRHGFAVDAHLVDPLSDIPTLKAVEAITITELE